MKLLQPHYWHTNLCSLYCHTQCTALSYHYSISLSLLLRIESKHEVTILGGLNEFYVKFFGPSGSEWLLQIAIYNVYHCADGTCRLWAVLHLVALSLLIAPEIIVKILGFCVILTV